MKDGMEGVMAIFGLPPKGRSSMFGLRLFV